MAVELFIRSREQAVVAEPLGVIHFDDLDVEVHRLDLAQVTTRLEEFLEVANTALPPELYRRRAPEDLLADRQAGNNCVYDRSTMWEMSYFLTLPGGRVIAFFTENLQKVSYDGGETFVAEDVAYGTLICVDPEFQGCGKQLGLMLNILALASAEKMGCETFIGATSAAESNHKVRRYYEKIGLELGGQVTDSGMVPLRQKGTIPEAIDKMTSFLKSDVSSLACESFFAVLDSVRDGD